jgi:hypothetical protein
MINNFRLLATVATLVTSRMLFLGGCASSPRQGLPAPIHEQAQGVETYDLASIPYSAVFTLADEMIIELHYGEPLRSVSIHDPAADKIVEQSQALIISSDNQIGFLVDLLGY